MSQDLEKNILEALDQEDPNLLRAACIMAGRLQLAQAERALLKALAHKTWQVQMEAARALGRIKSKGAAPYLKRLLKAADNDVRQKILAAAAGIKGEGEEVNPEVAKAAALALNSIDSKIAQDALLAALNSDQPPLINAAMAGLANLEAEAGREKMLELLDNDDVNLRRTAAASLGKLRESGAVPKLIALLEDEQADVRKEALIALNHIKDKNALAAVAQCLEDKDSDVRRVAAIALGNTQLKSAQVLAPLLRSLEDHDANVRQASLSALSNLKAGKALEAAAGLLRDTHEAVARQAALTVVNLAQFRDRPEYE